MLRHRNIERVCLYVLAVMLLITILFLALAAAGVISENTGMDYEARLFDQSRVHTIDITMADWDGFLETCPNEEYAACTISIDGEVYKNAAIRAKGNTSLTSVEQYGNDRYSFKVEFDHYQSGMTYHGLDKLSLNNLIQDNTYLKDYTAYTLMNKMGVAAPLCSFVQISVNGEPWGLYLAVEGVEDSFLARNYGKDHGELYKPDSMSLGGGRGNGRDFDADKMMEQFADLKGELPRAPAWGETTDRSIAPQTPQNGQAADKGGAFAAPPLDETPGADSPPRRSADRMDAHGGGPMQGMDSSDVKLIYTDDDPDSYANIFNNAKTDVSEADQARLIASLKALGEGDTSVINTDAVIRYMAVHNFLCNDDSYTGTMVHNYYLYEEDGVMEMIPWDYNLSMGGFTGGSNATATVNTGIHDLVSMGGDRPMADWILADKEAAGQYRAVYRTFMDTVFHCGWFEQEITRVIDMISPYVKRDPTAFCSYEAFVTASDTLRTFCLKRAESIGLQLSGGLSATSAQQDASSRIDASDLNLRSMGGMGGGFSEMPDGRSFSARPGSDERSRSMAGFKKAEAPEEPSAPQDASPDESGLPSAQSSASPEGFTPPDMFLQEGEAAAPVQPIGLLILCAAVLLAALALVSRSRPHQ